MPALHTAFRLVLERQREGAAALPSGRAGGPGRDGPRVPADDEVDPEPARAASDRSGHPVSRQPASS